MMFLGFSFGCRGRCDPTDLASVVKEVEGVDGSFIRSASSSHGITPAGDLRKD